MTASLSRPLPSEALPRSAPARPGRSAKKLPAALAQRSHQAKQRAAAILEVLAGGRTPLQAAQALGVSLGRYYLLEDQALAGLVAACEPQPRGRSGNDAHRLATLERDCARWQRECARQQTLVRAAQRTLGLAPPAAPDKAKKRQRRPVVRALAAASRLRPEPAAAASSTTPPAQG
jgi:hypothetical protein